MYVYYTYWKLGPSLTSGGTCWHFRKLGFNVLFSSLHGTRGYVGKLGLCTYISHMTKHMTLHSVYNKLYPIHLQGIGISGAVCYAFCYTKLSGVATVSTVMELLMKAFQPIYMYAHTTMYSWTTVACIKQCTFILKLKSTPETSGFPHTQHTTTGNCM